MQAIVPSLDKYGRDYICVIAGVLSDVATVHLRACFQILGYATTDAARGYCGLGAETSATTRLIENPGGEQGVGPRLGAP